MEEKDTRRFFYGWIIVAASFFAAMSYGLFHTFGVFFKSLQAEFGWSRTLTASVSSVHLMVYAVSGIMIGKVTDKYGPRAGLTIGAFLIGVGLMLCSRIGSIWQLYIFFGLIASLGAGVVYSLPSATVQRWFVEKRGLVLGIVMSGVGFSTMILAPLTNYLISSYGWRMAYIILGSGSLCVLSGVAMTMVSDPEKIGLNPYGFNKDKTDETLQGSNCSYNTSDNIGKGEIQIWTAKEAIKTQAFWVIYLLHFFAVLPLFMIMVHIVPFATDMGIPKAVAAGALGLIGGSSILGRILMGSLSDRIGWKNGITICVGCCCIITLWLINMRSVWALYVFVVFFGFFYGGKVPLFPGLVSSFFGTASLAEIMGIFGTGSGIGGMIGPLVGGYLYDKTGDYSIAFLLASGSYAISVVFSLIVRQPEKPLPNF